MEDKTIWRLTEADFKAEMEAQGIPKEEQEDILSQAENTFNIPTWAEYVQAFIECNREQATNEQVLNYVNQLENEGYEIEISLGRENNQTSIGGYSNAGAQVVKEQNFVMNYEDVKQLLFKNDIEHYES